MDEVMGVSNVCLESLPWKKVLKIRMDDWGKLSRPELKYLSEHAFEKSIPMERWEGFRNKRGRED
jgi:hypothetical protein